MSSIEKLRTYLQDITSGQVSFGHIEPIERLLWSCWDELQLMTDDSNLEPYKLLHRTEGLAWEPPLLKFEIERHGATVGGSVYAEVHQWSINLETSQASLLESRRRQVQPKDKRLDVKPLAQEIANAILSGEKDGRLRWTGSEQVRVKISDIISATNQQTTSGRRKRFRAELCRLLDEHGWAMTKINNFAKTAVSK